MGIGSQGAIHRLDRHPSMSKHPVTPADESDLRLHLAKQTTKQIGLLDILTIGKSQGEIHATLATQAQAGAEVMLIDALYDEQLLPIGATLDHYATNAPLFSVGSSGVEMALGKFWVQQGVLTPVAEWPSPSSVSPLLVISGSCSPVATEQISWAKANGFAEVVLNAPELAQRPEKALYLCAYKQAAINYMQQGQSVIVHTNGSTARPDQNLSSQKLGTALGLIARAVAQQTHVQRVVVAGGDTSSYAARAMGIEAVEMIAPLVPGAPLCRASAPGSPLHNVEINFKGGQVGSSTYLGVLREGRLF